MTSINTKTALLAIILFAASFALFAQSEKIPIGDGLFLLASEVDPAGSVLEIKATPHEWALLADENEYTNALANFADKVYKKFNDDFDFIFFVRNTNDNGSHSDRKSVV